MRRFSTLIFNKKQLQGVLLRTSFDSLTRQLLAVAHRQNVRALYLQEVLRFFSEELFKIIAVCRRAVSNEMSGFGVTQNRSSGLQCERTGRNRLQDVSQMFNGRFWVSRTLKIWE